MGFYSILHKISRATDPTRFVEPGKTAPAVWSSSTRVVDEQFEKRVVSEEAGHAIYERRAVATDLGRPDSVTELSLQREVRGGESAWSVCLKDGQKIVLKRAGEASVMIALYKKLHSSMTNDRGGAKLARVAAASAIAVVVVYAMLGAIGAATSTRDDVSKMSDPLVSPGAMAYGGGLMPSTSPAPQQVAQGAEPNSADSQLTDAERKDISKRANRINLGGTGSEMLVFSDPHCPYCQRLEAEIEELAAKSEGKVTLIPVAYKNGSRESVAAVFCAKDPAAAWKKAVAGGEIGAKVCDAGLKKVDENNQLFADLKLAATPTLITPKGLILASYANIDQLRQLIKL